MCKDIDKQYISAKKYTSELSAYEITINEDKTGFVMSKEPAKHVNGFINHLVQLSGGSRRTTLRRSSRL